MSISRHDFPFKGDLVIGTVESIKKHGIYLSLTEHEDITGYCHISEITGTFVRNIRNFVKIGEMRVAKVLRVDKDKRQVDISLKRVSDQQKRDKMQEYKRQNAAIAIVNLISEKSGKSKENIRDLIEDELFDNYGSLYAGFEEIAVTEGKAFDDLNIPEDLHDVILEVTESSIQITTVPITATLGLRSFAPDGVEHVKKILMAVEEKAEEFSDRIESEITSIGAPHYRVYLEGNTYDEVNEAYEAIEQALADTSKKVEVQYKLERNKK